MDDSNGEKKRLVVLVSGSGSNLQALLDACDNGDLPGEVVAVLADRRGAYGLVRAQEAGVASHYVPFTPYREAGRSRIDYDADLAKLVVGYHPDLVVLAGWMRILSAAFLDRFPERVVNLHPALPGQFAGTQAIERAFAAFQEGAIRESGCMVHIAIPEVDAGPVIDTRIVPIYPEDTLATFEERMHAAEHRLIVSAVGQHLAALP